MLGNFVELRYPARRDLDNNVEAVVFRGGDPVIVDGQKGPAGRRCRRNRSEDQSGAHRAAGGQTVSVLDGPMWGPLSRDGARIGQVALNRWSDPGDQILDVSGGGWLDLQLVACERQSYEMAGHQLHS